MKEIVIEPVYENTARFLIDALCTKSYVDFGGMYTGMASLLQHIVYLHNNNPAELRRIMQEVEGKAKML